MNQIVILALIASLQKEVVLLETELTQQQAVVATSTSEMVVRTEPVYVPPAYISPIQPILGSVSPKTIEVPAPPIPPVTIAWIEVNGETGTVTLASGTYGGDITWGSTNALSEPYGCILRLPGAIGALGNSGESNSGLFTHQSNIVSISCTGQYNDASSSVIVITSQ